MTNSRRTNSLLNIVTRRLNAWFIVFLYIFSPAYGEEIRPTVQVTAKLSGILGGETFVAGQNTNLSFDAKIAADNSPVGVIPSDVYFGVITPDQQVLTWVEEPTSSGGRRTTGVLGLRPLLRDFRMAWSATPNPPVSMAVLFQSQGASPFHHEFTDTDPNGLYWVFCLLVYAGQNPSDIRQWYAIDLKPLLVDMTP